MTASATPAPMNGSTILTRLITVDRPASAAVLGAVPATDRPAGLQIVAAPTASEIQRLTAMRAFAYLNPSLLTFLSAH